jgi:hypothetical protein
VAAGKLEDGAGELLPGEILAALAQRADTLETEAERGSGAHGRVIGWPARFLSATSLGRRERTARWSLSGIPKSELM